MSVCSFQCLNFFRRYTVGRNCCRRVGVILFWCYDFLWQVVPILQHSVTEKNYLNCVAQLKADFLISPACYMPHSFSLQQWRWYSSTRGQSNLATGCIDLILWSHEPTTKILRGGRRKWKLGLPLGTGSGKGSGAWTQNFSYQLPVSKHEQKVVIKMAASQPSRSEIGQVES